MKKEHATAVINAAYKMREHRIKEHYIDIRAKLTPNTQNARVWDYLNLHGEINCYEASRMNPPIMALHSRISDLRALGAEIYGETYYIRGVRYHTYFTERNECQYVEGAWRQYGRACYEDCEHYPYEKAEDDDDEMEAANNWLHAQIDEWGWV